MLPQGVSSSLSLGSGTRVSAIGSVLAASVILSLLFKQKPEPGK